MVFGSMKYGVWNKSSAALIMVKSRGVRGREYEVLGTGYSVFGWPRPDLTVDSTCHVSLT